MKKINFKFYFKSIVTLGFCSPLFLNAQATLPYSSTTYQYDSILNVQYGTAVDHAGNAQDLYLDIFKPINDSNCNRPIVVLVHGGAWVLGSKEDVDLIYLSRQFARRGYIVANVNYRLGTHKPSNWAMYAACDTNKAAPEGYICDSAEIYRANYRAMQDVKGAIRFMKNRSVQDSSDFNNVFVAGESAGGFIALSVAFMTDESEKPLNCSAINNAPSPDTDFNAYGCIPTPNDLSRPDLGPVDGILNLGTHDASVQGVGSFFGGMLDMNMVGSTPINLPVYLFHQGSDVIVHYNYGRLLGRISWECFWPLNICQPFYFYPFASGGKKIATGLTNLGWNNNLLKAEIIQNYEYEYDCFDNGHSLDSPFLRMQSMVDLFAERLATNGNTPSSGCSNSITDITNEVVRVAPNPVIDELRLLYSSTIQNTQYKIISPTGQEFLSGVITNNTLQLIKLPKGYYFIVLEGEINGRIPFVKN